MEGFRRYLVNNNRSQDTVKTYINRLEAFLLWLGDRRFTVDACRDYHEYLVSENYSGTGIIQRMAAIKAYGQWMMDTHKLKSNPAASVKAVKIAKQQHAPEVMSAEELAAYWDAVRSGGNKRDIAILETLLRTGLRIGELVALRWQDVDTAKRIIQVRRGKGGKIRKVPATPELLKVLEAWRVSQPQGEYVFPLTSAGIAIMLKRYGKAAGLTRNIHPHLFRHQFATELRRKGADIAQVAAALGHSSLNTTMIYTMPTEDEEREKMRNMYA